MASPLDDRPRFTPQISPQSASPSKTTAPKIGQRERATSTSKAADEVLNTGAGVSKVTQASRTSLNPAAEKKVISETTAENMKNSAVKETRKISGQTESSAKSGEKLAKIDDGSRKRRGPVNDSSMQNANKALKMEAEAKVEWAKDKLAFYTERREEDQKYIKHYKGLGTLGPQRASELSRMERSLPQFNEAIEYYSKVVEDYTKVLEEGKKTFEQNTEKEIRSEVMPKEVLDVSRKKRGHVNEASRAKADEVTIKVQKEREIQYAKNAVAALTIELRDTRETLEVYKVNRKGGIEGLDGFISHLEERVRDLPGMIELWKGRAEGKG